VEFKIPSDVNSDDVIRDIEAEKAAAAKSKSEAGQQKPADLAKPADASSKDDFKIITQDFTFPVGRVPEIQAKYPSVEIKIDGDRNIVEFKIPSDVNYDDVVGDIEAAKSAAEQERSLQAQKELDAKRALLSDNRLRVSKKTLNLSVNEINAVEDRLRNFGIDPQNLGFIIPVAAVIAISENENWLKDREKILKDRGIEPSIENIINVPVEVLVRKTLQERIKDSVNPLAASLKKWIENNIASERRDKSTDASLQLFVGDKALPEARSASFAGLVSAVIEQAQAKPAGSKRLNPNTVTPYIYNGKKYNVKVEHYAVEDGNIARIAAVVKLSPSLTSAIEAAGANINDIKREIYETSIPYFAADIENDRRQMQYSLGVSGVGMIVYSGGIESRKISASAQGELAQRRTSFLELSGENKKNYFTEKSELTNIGELSAEMASVKELGAAWQMPGHEFGLTINVDSANALSNISAAQRYMNNEKSKNVSIARVSSANIKDVIENLRNERIKGEKAADTAEINRVRNLLSTGREIRKVADLSAADLLNADRSVNRNFIQHAFEAGFDGIYADLSGLSLQDAQAVLGAIKEISAKYAIEAQNYVTLDKNISGDFVKGFTRIVKISGEKISAKDIKNALDEAGDYEGSPLAVEIEGISSGDELTLAQGRIVAAFMKNTSGISKDKSDKTKMKAQKRYETSYRKSLNSDYTLNIDSDKIQGLKEFIKPISEAEASMFADAQRGAAMFETMISALKLAGIREDSVAYQYVAGSAKENTAQSYASAKAYLRAAVENYLERQYLSAVGRTGTDKNDYVSGVVISDRNAIRSLMLYMALNGEDMSSDKIKALLDEQRTLLDGNKTLFELKNDNNPFINEILADPFADDSKEKAQEKKAQAKQALTVVSESAAASGINKAMETFKDGAFASTQTIKQILSAA
jgi:hypothetical protein